MSDFDEMSMLELFQMESEELTGKLDRLILTLDEQGDKPDNSIREIFRIIHTIKGSARTLSIQEICDFAHAMEDYLAQVMSGETVGRDDVDYLLRTVDWLKYFIQLTVTEQPFPSNLETLIQSVKLGQEIQSLVSFTENKPVGKPAKVNNLPLSNKEVKLKKENKDIVPNQRAIPQEAIYDTSSGTQRVSLRSLDSLLNLAGELYVKSTGIDRFKNDMFTALETTARLVKYSAALSSTMGARDFNHMENKKLRYKGPVEELVKLCSCLHQQVSTLFQTSDELNTQFKRLTAELREEVMQIRMVPLSRLFDIFPRMVRDLSRSLDKKTQITIKGEDTRIDKAVIEVLKAPLQHLVRNAIDHGIESSDQRLSLGKPDMSTINLFAFQQGDEVIIRLEDDGQGINMEEIRAKIVDQNRLPHKEVVKLLDEELMEFLFIPGFSTRNQVNEFSGRGVGLDVVKSEIEKIGGNVMVDSIPDQSTSFSLRLPLNLAVTHTLQLEAGQQVYAFPASMVEEYLHICPREIQSIGGKQIFDYQDQVIAVAWLTQLMGIEESERDVDQSYPALLFKMDETKVAIIAERFIGQSEVMVKPLDKRLKKVANIAGASISNEGRIILVVDIIDILNTVREAHYDSESSTTEETELLMESKKVLVVEDSLTVREMQRRLLQNAGYEVTLAVDGLDGLNKIRRQSFDLIISDIDMPRMNGLDLTKTLKSDEKYCHVPLIIVSYKDRPQDKQAGMEAGADHYVTKSQFDSEEFLQFINRLI